MHRLLQTAALAALLLLAAGCTSLPQAVPDTTRHFLLAAPPVLEEAPPAPPLRLREVRVDRVEIPSYLSGLAMVVRRSPNEIMPVSRARWAEPLDRGIARVIGEALACHPAAGQVLVHPTVSIAPDGLLVRIAVESAEGAADGRLLFVARWSVVEPAAGMRQVASGVHAPEDIRWDPDDYGTLAEGMSRAAAGLARAIGDALPREAAAP